MKSLRGPSWHGRPGLLRRPAGASETMALEFKAPHVCMAKATFAVAFVCLAVLIFPYGTTERQRHRRESCLSCLALAFAIVV